MKKNIGVEMTMLSDSDRKNLIKGMVLRRVPHGRPLSKQQLDTAINEDVLEVQRRFRSFVFKDYTGFNVDEFINMMVVGQSIVLRTHKSEDLYERGPLADSLVDEMPGRVQDLLDDLPMSTRGLFDDMRSRPSADRQVTVSSDEFNGIHNKGDKMVVTDHVDNKSPNSGPIILPKS